MSLACILGCEGPVLGGEERAFLRDVRPWGFILFARNVDTPDQVRALTDSLREAVDREDAPILIDQEGGRVQRLRPPHWPSYPAARAYVDLSANDPLTRREAARLGARLMAYDLAAVGINVDCVPVLDVPAPDGHAVIGDRAYARTPDEVAVLGRAAAEGLLAGGVLPVIKHIPGHGRAHADSHKELPVVEASADDLDGTDFAPFRVLSDMPMAMTAHVVYAAVDPHHPATTSRKVMKRVVRRAIGYDGLVMTDDLGMRALSGSLAELAKASLEAGCDVVLHCSGRLDENRQVADAAPELEGKAKRRAKAALARLVRAPEPLDEGEARARFAELTGGRAATGAPVLTLVPDAARPEPVPADPTRDGRDPPPDAVA